jgi:hypothetical protein
MMVLSLELYEPQQMCVTSIRSKGTTSHPVAEAHNVYGYVAPSSILMKRPKSDKLRHVGRSVNDYCATSI